VSKNKEVFLCCIRERGARSDKELALRGQLTGILWMGGILVSGALFDSCCSGVAGGGESFTDEHAANNDACFSELNLQ
jgi:hypothetical protein